MVNLSKTLENILEVFNFDSAKKKSVIDRYESIVIQRTANLLLENTELKSLIEKGEEVDSFVKLASTDEKAANYLFAASTAMLEIADTLLKEASENEKIKVAEILKSNKILLDLILNKYNK